MNTAEKIQIVLNSLNQLTIKGRQNLDYLLGSIQLLEQIKQEVEEKPNDNKPNQD